MRRLAAALGALILAALALSSAARAAAPERVDCKVKKLTILFWPEGHHEIPSVDFPEFLLPHLEVYEPGPPYPDSSFLAFVGSGAGQWSRSCKAVEGSRAPTHVTKRKSVTTTSALHCTLPKKSLFERVDSPGRSALRLFAGTELYAKVVITAFGGVAIYNSNACRADPAPT